MAKTPVVIINSSTSASLESFYQSTLDSIDARYHRGGNSFPITHETEREAGERISLTSFAEHAGDGYTKIDDLHYRCPDGKIRHPEKLLG
jgi:hypothetical protein